MRESGFRVSGGDAGPGPRGAGSAEEPAAGAGESDQGRGLEVSKKNPAESLLSMGEDGYDGFSGILRIYVNIRK